MKKRMERQPKRVIPAFATEAEEAEWWYRNRNIHGKQLLVAVKSGEAQVLTCETLMHQRLQEGPVADAFRAKRLAARLATNPL